MTCLNHNKQGTQTLLDYCAGTLEPERAVALEKHAGECAGCRDLIAAQKDLWSALDQLEAPEISADFDARLYARIASEGTHPGWRAWWNRVSLQGFMLGASWKPVLAGVAAVAVLVVGLTVRTHDMQDAGRQLRPDSVDVEQLEVTLQDLEMLTPPSASAVPTPSGTNPSGTSSSGKM
jgi:anti-sigma-K factor RskA